MDFKSSIQPYSQCSFVALDGQDLLRPCHMQGTGIYSVCVTQQAVESYNSVA